MKQTKNSFHRGLCSTKSWKNVQLSNDEWISSLKNPVLSCHLHLWSQHLWLWLRGWAVWGVCVCVFERWVVSVAGIIWLSCRSHFVTSSQPSFTYPQIALPSLGPHPGAREPGSTHPSLVSILRRKGLKVSLLQSTSFVSKTFLTIDFPFDWKFLSFWLSSLLDFN